MIDRSTISKIMDAARIEDVVGDFVTLKRAGANLKGLCPFHDDRTPSFIVSPAKNFCKCFACGKGGNPVGFIMEHEQLTYPDALRWLAKKYGITIEEKEMSEEDKIAKNDNESMYILNEWARDWFSKQLYDTEDGRAIGLAYFRSRGFRDDILKKFQVGYCPNDREHSLSADAIKAGYKEKYLANTPDDRDPRKSVGTGLCFKSDRDGSLRDRFFGRVMWPIFTVGGKVAGFGGRVLDAATKGVNMKYQNSPESSIYSKRRELYGLYQAKQAITRQDLCYLVEGYTDVMAMHQCGMENVVASSGTALTEEQIRLIHRFTSNIVVIYDGDAAGIKASQRGIDMLLAQGMNVKLLMLPDGDDPDSFARKHNTQEYQAYMAEHQVDFIKFKTNLLMEEAKGDPMKMSRLVNNIVQSIAVIPDEITRSFYVKETASMMSTEERLIVDAVAKQVAKNKEEWRKQKDRENYRAAFQLGAQQPAQDDNAESAPLPGSESDWVPPSEDDINKTYAPLPDPGTEPLVQSKNKKEQLRFYQKELEIMRIIIRHGSEVMCVVPDENDNNVELTTLEFIYLTLSQEQIKLRTALHQQMLEEGYEHASDADFDAEKFYLNHQDPAINSLAFELGTDKEVLSKLHQLPEGAPDNTPPLKDLVAHVMQDYRLALLDEEKTRIMQQLGDPQLLKDKAKYTEVMTAFMQIKKMEKDLGHNRGDRVLN